MVIHTVGVVGCGTMGAGIALAAARSGYDTIVLEISQALLEKGLARIDSLLDALVADGAMEAEKRGQARARITGATQYSALSACDLVIEAAPEQLELKHQILKSVEAVVRPETILASNTSSLPIVELAAVLERPERMVGLHFCHPSHIMPLLELIASLRTDAAAAEMAYDFGRSLGKTVIRAKDYPGFIINYLQYPFRLNAIRMVERGMASPADIDAAARLGLGHPYGPLEFQDSTGLDVTYHACKAIYEATHDPLFAPPVLMQQMVAAGLLGRKTGKGFYDYAPECAEEGAGHGQE